MIVVRHTQQAKYGMGDQVLTLLKETFDLVRQDPRVKGVRIVTDLSGPAFTVEVELHVESLAVYEQVQRELLAGAAFNSWFVRLAPLVDHGHLQFFTLRS